MVLFKRHYRISAGFCSSVCSAWGPGFGYQHAVFMTTFLCFTQSILTSLLDCNFLSHLFIKHCFSFTFRLCVSAPHSLSSKSYSCFRMVNVRIYGDGCVVFEYYNIADSVRFYFWMPAFFSFLSSVCVEKCSVNTGSSWLMAICVSLEEERNRLWWWSHVRAFRSLLLFHFFSQLLINFNDKPKRICVLSITILYLIITPQRCSSATALWCPPQCNKFEEHLWNGICLFIVDPFNFNWWTADLRPFALFREFDSARKFYVN